MQGVDYGLTVPLDQGVVNIACDLPFEEQREMFHLMLEHIQPLESIEHFYIGLYRTTGYGPSQIAFHFVHWTDFMEGRGVIVRGPYKPEAEKDEAVRGLLGELRLHRPTRVYGGTGPFDPQYKA